MENTYIQIDSKEQYDELMLYFDKVGIVTAYSNKKAYGTYDPLIIWITNNNLTYSNKNYALQSKRNITPFSKFKSKYIKTIPAEIKLEYIKILHMGISTQVLDKFYYNYPNIKPVDNTSSINALNITSENINILNDFATKFTRKGIIREYKPNSKLCKGHISWITQKLEDTKFDELKQKYFLI
ncbi:MAG: hypothetical protein H8E98_03135 [Bacteroidetes bacterium]|nr:hypothetical protein [Bacteroidota bacterium]